jgi:hypothetical protein
MRETRSSGSVRGASGDGRPYRERKFTVARCSNDGPLTDSIADLPAGDGGRQPMPEAVWKPRLSENLQVFRPTAARRDGLLGRAVPAIHGSQPTG